MKKAKSRSSKWSCLTVPRTLRKELSGIAMLENRTIPGMIAELSEFWRMYHCPECQREVLSGTCPCKQHGV